MGTPAANRRPPAASARRYARAHGRRFLRELAELVRIPSVSADPRHRADVVACAEWLRRHLLGMGIPRVELLEAGGPPVVVAAHVTDARRPTVLVYGHYDVQPAGPAGAWTSPPFAPTIRRGRLYGRGASDDKGQLFAHLKAIESLIRTRGAPPVNVVCVLEGEEEVGSRHLAPVLRTLTGLRPDVVVVSDTRMLGPDRPAITVALRGSVHLEVQVGGLAHGLHSGAFGGAVPNPGHGLAQVVASMHDARGRVAVPGFYDDVRDVPTTVRRRLAPHVPRDADMRAAGGGAALAGEPGWTAFERSALRPAVNVTGLCAGYCGPGSLNAVPAAALARVNVRLVPGQSPGRVAGAIRAHVEGRTLCGLTQSVRTLAASPPVALQLDQPVLALAGAAYLRGFGRRPVLVPSGGSIPSVPHLVEAFGSPVVLMGFGLPDDNMHAPNEHLDLVVFNRAIATCTAFLEGLADFAFASRWTATVPRR